MSHARPGSLALPQECAAASQFAELSETQHLAIEQLVLDRLIEAADIFMENPQDTEGFDCATLIEDWVTEDTLEAAGDKRQRL